MGPTTAAAGLWIAPGARAAEAWLLDQLEARVAAIREDPRGLAEPVRVVVPSRSLRDHLAAAFVRRSGRARAGFEIQTLFAVALEIHDRAGEAPAPGQALLPLLVRREARAEPALRDGLDHLDDGYGAASGVVADLLDAGFLPAHAGPLEELLEARGGEPARRAAALVRATARCATTLAGLGLAHRADLLRRARELLEAGLEAALPAHAVFVHGFAEATGAATDLIEALVRRRGACILVDRPPDPCAPAAADPGASFSDRLCERLSFLGVTPIGMRPPAAEIALVRAAGLEAETRAVAERIRALLDDGARPEDIGVVFRHLPLYRAPVRRHFGRLAIPFSGAPGETGPATGAGRRIHALLDVLRRGADLPAERWLDALAALPVGPSRDGSGAPRHARLLSHARRAELRLALHAIGAARLRDAASLDAGELVGTRSGLPLPVRHGLLDVGEVEAGARTGADPHTAAEAGGASGGGDGERARPARATRRWLPRAALERAVQAARALAARLETWPPHAAAGRHAAVLRELLDHDLGWPPGSPLRRAVDEALGRVERELPRDLELGFDELTALLRGMLRDAGATPLGGAGAGVAVLDATAARARTFEHLFVLGMNRDVFPRAVAEDALLPDALRRELAVLLPDLPIKETGHREERYLFAQLVSSSPRVTLSWCSVDDDARERAPSAFVERLRTDLGLETATAPALPAPHGAGAGAPLRPAREHALAAGLFGTREAFAAVLPAALREVDALGIAASERRAAETGGRAGPVTGASGSGAAHDWTSWAALARARTAILCELDPDLRTPEGRARARGLGPYFGFVGAAAGADPRGDDPYVTTVERTAICPWQVLVERMLRVEPVPDALEALPAVTPLLLGTLLHRVLERVAAPEPVLFREAAPRALEAAVARPARRLRWPGGEQLERILRATAEEVRREEGIALPGFSRVLAERARPFLAAARERLAAGGGPAPDVVGTELEGGVDVEDACGRPRRIAFRADLVERVGGVLRLTDYKTGKRTVSEAQRADTRASHLARGVARGRWLQAVAYALGAGEPDAEGRYLFLHPEIEAGRASFRVEAGSRELSQAFRGAVARVLDAWDAGAFFPRLVEPDRDEEPDACRFCAVAQACLRGDSGARRRLREWADRPDDAGAPAERALRALYALPARADDDGPRKRSGQAS